MSTPFPGIEPEPGGVPGGASGARAGQRELPVKNGFRLRGAEMSRLETFADAAFAFALTLLVISIDEIPDSFEELSAALRTVPVFAACFAIVVMFWLGHRTWSQRYGLDDSWSTFLTLALVFTIMVYVYPLKVLLTEGLSVLTGDWVPSRFRAESFAEVRTLFGVYSAGWTASSLSILLLFRHAFSKRASLDLNEREVYETRTEIQGWSLITGAGVVSILIALAVPENWIPVAGWIYALLGIIMPVHGHLRGRRRPPVAA